MTMSAPASAPPRNPAILSLIGHTPLVEITRLDTGGCQLFVKLESQNPGGSIKDRIALSMIEAAEADGRLKPGGTVVEATAGNTGLGLALVARAKGYRIVLVIPDKMAVEKVRHLKALGADIRMTRSDVGKGHPQYYQDMAAALAAELPGAFYVNQFGNPANPLAHEQTTGPEIWEQMQQDVDAVVCGVGSGGTLTGLTPLLRAHEPAYRDGARRSPGFGAGRLRRDRQAGRRQAPGSSRASARISCRRSRPIRGEEGLLDSRRGEPCHGARAAARGAHLRRIVVRHAGGRGAALLPRAALSRSASSPSFCDTGSKYLSKMYNDFWMVEQGFAALAHYGDLRDLVTAPLPGRCRCRRRSRGHPAHAAQRMRMADVSQVPVLAADQVVGILDESDVLLHVHKQPDRFRDPVATAMTQRLETLDPGASFAELLAIFERDGWRS